MMTKELKTKLKDSVQEALINLGVQPESVEDLNRALNAVVLAFPHMNSKQVTTVTTNAASGKYGIPFKFVPALVGQWFHKDHKDFLENNKGGL